MAARIPSFMTLYLVLLILSWKLCLVPVMARPLNALENLPDVSGDKREDIFVSRSVIMQEVRDKKHSTARLLEADQSGPSPSGPGHKH